MGTDISTTICTGHDSVCRKTPSLRANSSFVRCCLCSVELSSRMTALVCDIPLRLCDYSCSRKCARLPWTQRFNGSEFFVFYPRLYWAGFGRVVERSVARGCCIEEILGHLVELSVLDHPFVPLPLWSFQAVCFFAAVGECFTRGVAGLCPGRLRVMSEVLTATTVE